MNEIDVGARDRMMEEERKQKIGSLLNGEQEKQIFIADQFCQKKSQHTYFNTKNKSYKSIYSLNSLYL
jgi:hypothetical protein